MESEIDGDLNGILSDSISAFNSGTLDRCMEANLGAEVVFIGGSDMTMVAAILAPSQELYEADICSGSRGRWGF